MERVLALPREAGTPAAAAARDLVADHLEALGYQVNRQRFAFAPSSLNGFPMLRRGPRRPGAAAAAAAHRRAGCPAGRAALVLAGGLLLLAAGRRDRPRLAPAGRCDARGCQPDRDARRRAGSRAGSWPISTPRPRCSRMAGRLVAVWVIGVAVAVADGARRWPGSAGPIPCRWRPGGLQLAVMAGALAGRGRLHGASAGARDNGSGVLAALAAAEAGLDPGDRHLHHRRGGVRAGGRPRLRRPHARRRGLGRRWSSTSTRSTRRASSPS